MDEPKGTVLLVEDHKDILAANRRIFEKAGYGVRTATTLAAARRQLLDTAPDLMVLDILLPDGSGLDFCAELLSTPI